MFVDETRVRQVSDRHALTLMLSLNGCLSKNWWNCIWSSRTGNHTRMFWPRLSVRVSHPCLIESDRYLMNCRPTPRFVSLVTILYLFPMTIGWKAIRIIHGLLLGGPCPDGSAPGGCYSVSSCRFPWCTAAFTGVDKCYEWLVCCGWIWETWLRFTALAARFRTTVKRLLKATLTLIGCCIFQPGSNILRNWERKKSPALCVLPWKIKTSFWILPSGSRCKVVSLKTSTVNCNLNSHWCSECQKHNLTHCKWACISLPVVYSCVDVSAHGASGRSLLHSLA